MVRDRETVGGIRMGFVGNEKCDYKGCRNLAIDQDSGTGIYYCGEHYQHLPTTVQVIKRD